MHPRSCTVKKGSRADRGWSLYACLAVVHFWCGPATRGMCQPRKQGWGLHLPLKESGTKWTLPERLGSRPPRRGLPRGHPPRAPRSPPRPGLTRGPPYGGPPWLPAPGSPVAPKEASLSILSVLFGVYLGGWIRQNSANHPPVGVFSKEDGMVRHPLRPKVGQKIGPREDGEGPKPRGSTRRGPPD